MSRFDSVFGIHGDALQLREARGRVLASNLANADTPNYKAQDFDFKAALRKHKDSTELGIKSSNMSMTNQRHIAGDMNTTSASEYLRYRVPTQPSLDGNTVETHIEKAKFMENAIGYSMSLQFLDDRIKSLKEALRSQ